MKIDRRSILLAVGALPLLSSVGLRAQTSASAFPSRPVTLLVPFAPGGASDTITRTLALQLAKQWGQSVVVDNKPGGNTIIATAQVARAAPDGHNLLLATFAWVTNPLMEKSLPYTTDSLRPVGLIGYQPHVLYVRRDIPARDIRELAAYVKRLGRPLSIGNAGDGSSPHLAAVDFAARSGIPVLHVPYKGTSPALNDLMGGQLDALFEGPLYRQHVEAGAIRAMLVAQDGRVETWPGLATATQAGVPGFTSSAWFALLVPAATPPEVQSALSNAINSALADAGVHQKLLDAGIVSRPIPQAEVIAFVEAQRRKLAPIIVSNRIARP